MTWNEKVRIRANYLRNFIFGSEDSLVSTVGMLSGVAVANVPQTTIILAGIILIFVSAFSMTAGSILSDNSAKEYLAGKDLPLRNSLSSGAIMFFSYALVGTIPLIPYALFPSQMALPISITLSLIALLIIGLISAQLTGSNKYRSALEMGLIGGLAIILGMVVGQILSDIPGF